MAGGGRRDGSIFKRVWRSAQRKRTVGRTQLPKLQAGRVSTEGESAELRIVCVDYCAERCEIREVADIEEFLARHRPEWSRVRWIGVCGLGRGDVVRALAKKYQLHPLAVEDVLHTTQRPKLEDFPSSGDQPGRLFLIARAMEIVDDRLIDEQVSLFLGRTTLLTFQERLPDVFEPVLGRLKNPASRLRDGDVGLLLYSLLDVVVDSYFPILDQYANRLEELEEELLDHPNRATLQKIHSFRRDLVLLRRTAWPMRDLASQLVRERHVCLSEATVPFYRDLNDHFVQIIDLVHAFFEIAASLTETYLSTISNRMNEVMKVLTIIGTIFIPLTFLAGVYGMNMPIPENQWWFTYPLFWAVCAAIAGGMLVWFKRRDWL